VVVLIAATTTVAVTHHGSPFGLGRQTGAPGLTPTAPPPVNQSVSPPAAAVGNAATRIAARKAPGTAARSKSTAHSGTVPAASGSANSYPGSVSCPQSGIPSPNPYAWEC